MSFVLVPGGEFMMGSHRDNPSAAPDEKPQKKVRISPFLLAVTDVTQEQYKKVMASNPSWFSSAGGGKELVKGKLTNRFPVENAPWVDASSSSATP